MEEFSLNESGELFILWNLNTNYVKLSFNELVSDLIQEYRHTGGVYDAFMQNDGKLIGNEKIVIIRNIRDIIQLSIVIKNLLRTKYIKKEETSESEIFDTKFLDEFTFQIKHKYSKDDYQKITSVKQWYDQYFKVQIIKFTEGLRKALEDKVITDDDAFSLIGILD